MLRMSPFMARLRHADEHRACPVVGEDRNERERSKRSVDPTPICGNAPNDRSFPRHGPSQPVDSIGGLGRIERIDRDVVSVRISKREFRSSSVGIHVWLFLQPANKRAPLAKLRQNYLPRRTRGGRCQAWRGGTCQRGMLVGPHSWRQSRTVPSVSTICPK